jgi:hypothetical protein
MPDDRRKALLLEIADKRAELDLTNQKITDTYGEFGVHCAAKSRSCG